ncbi:G-protein subunit gamma [Cavenderia fasciculata]|uniref:G-protein subunit gamma n=1 Tax=Cavenderia fasciculata TaxID=261658 RepID=F4PJ69_CACFS|nr:G-protein subunit gamma [Cavenderia fasciculata]EGG24355.1 G-protein subunit gamma [Cavenderia fasciculata]|eukprot:XP_004362206.1 G-protein subunit gamma [Cavenderia fasciculata]
MSESQLKKVLKENEVLKAQLERSLTILKVSEACATLQDYCTKTPDPFIPGWQGENEWTKPLKGGSCSVL